MMFLLPSDVFAQANTWAKKPDILTLRRAFSASVVDEIIDVIGGNLVYGRNLAFDDPTARVDAYNPATTDTWSTKADMPLGRREVLVASSVDGNIYAIGGGKAGSLFIVNDAVTDT